MELPSSGFDCHDGRDCYSVTHEFGHEFRGDWMSLLERNRDGDKSISNLFCKTGVCNGCHRNSSTTWTTTTYVSVCPGVQTQNYINNSLMTQKK